MSIINLTPSQLRHAADLQEQIEALQNQLAGITTVGGTTPSPAKPAKPAKRTMSASARAKIRAAQKARWAAIRAGKPAAAKAAAAKPAKKGRRKMSAEGRARIAAAARARWAKVRAAKAGKG